MKSMKNKKYFFKIVYKKCIHRFCLIYNLTAAIGGSPTRGLYPHCPVLTNSYVFLNANIFFIILFTTLNTFNEWCLLLI